jgi:hypothetical protein
MASYSEPGSNKINIYLPKFIANDSDYLKYGFGRVKLGKCYFNLASTILKQLAKMARLREKNVSHTESPGFFMTI